jgi:hypothetical protein
VLWYNGNNQTYKEQIMSDMSTQIENEVIRIINQTKTGQKAWGIVPGQQCHYQTLSETEPRLVVSCCNPDYRLEINGIRFDVPQSLLMILCGEIIEQHKRSKEQMPNILKLLHEIK